MSDSFITPDEWNTLALGSTLQQRHAWLYSHVSQTQLSIARHYGVLKINGDTYTYFPTTDELIRDDVLKAVTKLREHKKAQGLPVDRPQQLELIP